MSDNKKFIAGLILGAVAGAALAIFLSGEKCKEVIEDAKETAEDWAENIKNKLEGLGKEVNDLLEKGKSFAGEVENRAKDIIS